MTVYYQRKVSTLKETRTMRMSTMMLNTSSQKRASIMRLICTIGKKNGNQSSMVKSLARRTQIAKRMRKMRQKRHMQPKASPKSMNQYHH